MGVVCVHILEDGHTVCLVDPEDPQRILAGPEGIDGALFTAGGELSASAIQTQLFTNNAGSFVATGRKLFDAVFKGEVRDEWTKARDAWETEMDRWEQQPSGARPVFRTSFCVQNEVLAAIPWELLHSAAASLFQSQYACCMRSTDPVPRSRPDPGQIRIRVLLINGADPMDPRIQAEDETSGIESALEAYEHAFDVETIRTATPGAPIGVNTLEDKIREFAPHVLHFIGHSEAAGGGQPAALLLHDGAHYVRWTTLQIANFLPGIPTLPLAYLNACRTQQQGPLANHVAAPAYSLAEAFLRRSLAVIAMQYDVRGPAAALCARIFYGQLATNSTVDQAICAARHKLTGDFGAESREPYLPALVIRVRPEHILRLRPGDGQLTREDVETHVSPLAKHFVNHTLKRREVYDYLFDKPQDERRAVLVLGDDGVGKSWLIKWTLYCLVLRGIRVHYIGQVKDNWLEILRQIRSPGVGPLSQGCCDEDQANRFNWALKHLSAGNEVPAYQGAFEPDEGKTLSEIMDGSPKPANDFPQKLSKQLLTILGSGAETVLAIDQWNLGPKGVEDSTFRLLYENLLDPLARRRNSPVRLLLSLTGAQEKDFPGWRPEPLAQFGAGDLPKYTVQLLKRMYGDQVRPEHIAFVQRIAVQAISARKLHDTLAGFQGVFFK
jgi:hypothetical protein